MLHQRPAQYIQQRVTLLLYVLMTSFLDLIHYDQVSVNPTVYIGWNWQRTTEKSECQKTPLNLSELESQPSNSLLNVRLDPRNNWCVIIKPHGTLNSGCFSLPSLDHPEDLQYLPRLAMGDWWESLQHPVCTGGHLSKHTNWAQRCSTSVIRRNWCFNASWAIAMVHATVHYNQ